MSKGNELDIGIIDLGVTMYMPKAVTNSDRPKAVTNSDILNYYRTLKNVHISTTRCPTEMGFGSKYCILNTQLIPTQN